MIVTVARDDRDHALRHREGRAGKAEHLRGAAVLTWARTFSTTWYLRLEEAEPPTPVRQVVDVARRGLDEAVHLVDQLRHEGRTDAGDHDRQNR